MFSVTVIVCAYPARKLHNLHIQSPTPASQYRTTSVPAHPAGTPTQPSPRATIIAGNVAQRCRAALTGNRKGHKRRLRVPGGTHRLRKGAKTLLESGRNKMRGGKILSGPRYLCGLELLSRGKDRFLEYSCQVQIWFKLRKFHESLKIIVMIDHFTDSVDFLLGLVFWAWFGGLGLGGLGFWGSIRHLQPWPACYQET